MHDLSSILVRLLLLLQPLLPLLATTTIHYDDQIHVSSGVYVHSQLNYFIPPPQFLPCKKLPPELFLVLLHPLLTLGTSDIVERDCSALQLMMVNFVIDFKLRFLSSCTSAVAHILQCSVYTRPFPATERNDQFVSILRFFATVSPDDDDDDGTFAPRQQSNHRVTYKNITIPSET